MQNGYVPKDLCLRGVGQLWLASLAHDLRNVQTFGVRSVKGRTMAPQVSAENEWRWIPSNPECTQCVLQAIVSSDIALRHLLLLLLLIWALLKQSVLYIQNHIAYMELKNQAVDDESFYSRCIGDVLWIASRLLPMH